LEHLSKQQLLALLTAAREHSERDWLMILVAFWHGLRASEVVAIKANDIQDGYLTVDRLKGSNRTTQGLVVHPDALLSERQPLIDSARKCHGNQRIFKASRITFWRAVRRAAKAASIPVHLAHPHILKHSIAMQSIETAGIENVRQHLGHKSIASTGEYLKVDDSKAGSVVVPALGGLIALILLIFLGCFSSPIA
jgi:integrase